MTEQSAKVDMRKAMPRTARWVAEQREKFGALHTDGCIRAALKGARNQFYAVEGGHIVGAPFDWNERALFVVSMSILSGAPYVAAMRDPDGVVDLAIAELPASGSASGTN